jgi:hypothetical protein
MIHVAQSDNESPIGVGGFAGSDEPRKTLFRIRNSSAAQRRFDLAPDETSLVRVRQQRAIPESRMIVVPSSD